MKRPAQELDVAHGEVLNDQDHEPDQNDGDEDEPDRRPRAG
jgi:hypothetical protein